MFELTSWAKETSDFNLNENTGYPTYFNIIQIIIRRTFEIFSEIFSQRLHSSENNLKNNMAAITIVQAYINAFIPFVPVRKWYLDIINLI